MNFNARFCATVQAMPEPAPPLTTTPEPVCPNCGHLFTAPRLRFCPACGQETDIKAPTLVIHGTNDADVSVENAQYAAETIPHVELYLVPGGFHIMALTDSIDSITQKRVNFLQEHAPK